MFIEYNLYFEKNIDSEVEEWKSTFYESNNLTFIENFQTLMQTLQESISEIKKLKNFSRFSKIIITNKDHNSITRYNNIMVIKSLDRLTDSSFINLEYLLMFDWIKMNKITLCKIIKYNFLHLIYNIEQGQKNHINNITKIKNLDVQELLIKNFNIPKIPLTEKIDSQNIKSYIYKTPIRYRNT